MIINKQKYKNDAKSWRKKGTSSIIKKKAKSHKQPDPLEEKATPKTFIFKKGQCSNTCKQLVKDVRKCLYPNTAMNLQDSNKLAIKSYLKAAKYYSVTHLLAFQQSKKKTYLRLIKVGGGEITFRIMNYCNMKNIVEDGRQPFSMSFKEPLVVLNSFTENNQVRQIGRSIQELFPSINLDKIQIAKIKRVMSFTYQPNKKCIYFRHYKLIVEEGTDSSFKELLKKDQSDISNYRSFGEFLKSSQVNGNENNVKNTQQGIKLMEMGPRMKLKFISFKEGFGRIEVDEGEEEMKEVRGRMFKKESEQIEEQQ